MSFSPSEYWNNRLKDNFTLVGVGDISMGMAYNKYSYNITFLGLRRIFNKYCKNKKASVLDIGTGVGFIYNSWKRCGYADVDGSDISSFAVEQLKQKFKTNNFYELDISLSTNVLQGKKYNYVTCVSVLYHIVDDEKWRAALKNIRSLMSEGGIFIFTEGFPEHQQTITHQVLRTRDQYKKALLSAGFDLIESKANYILMSDPAGTKSKFYKYWWYGSSLISRKFPKLAYLWWAAVFPVERAMTKFKKTTPGQEFWICKAV
ncbi:MAG TPA: class I SAM-dependent methyltransferase [Flavipsychrobacter sp.]|nr:class I SAM-dependent methyltransferase [Flavipsychrobacter sp.]